MKFFPEHFDRGRWYKVQWVVGNRPLPRYEELRFVKLGLMEKRLVLLFKRHSGTSVVVKWDAMKHAQELATQ